MIKAIIFDMDGLLLDSEPIWQDCEIEIFSKYGIKLNPSLCQTTKGLKINEVIKHWSIIYNKKLPLKLIQKEIIDFVADEVKKRGPLKEGVLEIFNLFKELKIPCAIASSSPLKIILSFLEKYNFNSFFQVIHSAEKEKFGKPHPAVFLTAAKKLKVDPQFCLVFEDSINGMIAAKAARMKCVCIPELSEYNKKEFELTDVKIKSLNAFSKSILANLNSFK